MHASLRVATVCCVLELCFLSAYAAEPTVINLTNHAYFNLTGAGDVLGHELQLMSNTTTMIDDSRIPTGGIALVAGKWQRQVPGTNGTVEIKYVRRSSSG